MSAPRWLHRVFDHYQVPFEIRTHAPAYTASELAQQLHITGRRVAKTVFLNADSRPVAVVLPANTAVDPQRVQRILGSPNARFASEPEMAAWFKGCEPGAVPPLRLRNDERVLMDRSLAHFGSLTFPAGTLTDAVTVRFRDWYRMVCPGVGRFAALADGHPPAPLPNVLVVEEEEDTNHLMCQLLEHEGITCRGVRDGGHALAMASETPPSAILLDLMLPDMDGLDVYERLRRAGPLRRTPVVIVTALDDNAARERCRQLGADAYLTKPLLAQTLVEELHEVLEDGRD
jgi:Ala-tRNA(Pro) deacylase